MFDNWILLCQSCMRHEPINDFHEIEVMILTITLPSYRKVLRLMFVQYFYVQRYWFSFRPIFENCRIVFLFSADFGRLQSKSTKYNSTPLLLSAVCLLFNDTMDQQSWMEMPTNGQSLLWHMSIHQNYNLPPSCPNDAFMSFCSSNQDGDLTNRGAHFF